MAAKELDLGPTLMEAAKLAIVSALLMRSHCYFFVLLSLSWPQEGILMAYILRIML